MGANIIIEAVERERYEGWFKRYKISVNHHALFRLSQAQRNLFKDQDLIDILKNEAPVFVGLQQNGRYAGFFKRKNGYIRVIFQFTGTAIEIGTFYNTDKLPQLRK